MAALDDTFAHPAAGMPDDMQTIAMAKPVAAPLPEVAVMGANPDSAVPFVFGKQIAKGGMGAILEGEDCKLGRTIAVKVMLDPQASSEEARRFVQEAAVLGRLEHPNIVPIHDLGRDSEGALYYTMKLVKGVTLQKILDDLRKEEPAALAHYTLDRLLTIFRKVCDALAFAHAQKIIHRDLKPENIMVGEFGEVLVMDWGIAKILGESTADVSTRSAATSGTGSFTATLDGDVMGTPQYMSPEQAMGKVNELDERSDVFSLGGILYAILTLRPPVEGKTLDEVLNKVRTGSIASPSALQASSTTKGNPRDKGEVLDAKLIKPLPHVAGGRVPASLSSVAMKALQLEKTQRYQSVAEFSADIEAYQTGFATKAEQAGLAKQLLLLIKRNKGIFGTAAAALLLIWALAVWFMFNLHVKEQRALAGEASAVAAQNVAEQEEEAARHSLAKAAISLAESAQREGDGLAMQAALEEVPDDLRDSTWNYLFEQSDTSIARVRIGTTSILGVAAHPRQPGVFAVTDRENKVTLIAVRTGQRLLEFTPSLKKISGRLKLAFSADGERIAVGQADGAGGIVIHSARDGKKLLEWDASRSERLDFSPDGSRLLQTANDQKQIHVWDTAQCKLAWSYPPEKGGWVHGVFTPDGQQIVTTESRENLRLVNARDGSLVRELPHSRNTIIALAMHADGTVTAAGSGGMVMRIDLRNDKVLADFRAGDRRVSHVALTPDGGRIVTVVPLPDGRQDIRLWNANTGAAVQTLLGGSGGVTAISVHPISGELLVGGPSARVWSLTGTPEKWALKCGNDTHVTFAGGDDVIFAPATPTASSSSLLKLQPGASTPLWKPDDTGYRLPTVSADGRFAAIASITNGRPIVLLRNPGAAVEQVATFEVKSTPTLLRISPTGDRLAMNGRYRNRVDSLDTTSGKQSVSFDCKDLKRIWDLGWLDGQRLLGFATAKAERGDPGSEEWIVVWDAATGKILQTATDRTALDVLAIAPDGKRFADAGADNKVRIRDAATLAVQQEFRVHDGPITALAWHPKLPILATGSTDLSIRLWNVDTGRRLEEFRGPLGWPNVLSFSPGGKRLACSAQDGFTRIWEPESLNDKPATPQATGDWEDLLAPLTPVSVAETGHGWRMEGGVLLSPNKKSAILPLPGNFANSSYQLRVKLRQLTPKECFYLSLPIANRMAGFNLDGFPSDGYITSVQQVNGKRGKDVPGAVTGRQVNDSELHDLEVTVHLFETGTTITTTLDGQPLYEWSGPLTALSQSRHWADAPAGSIALGALDANWVVYEVKAKRLDN